MRVFVWTGAVLLVGMGMLLFSAGRARSSSPSKELRFTVVQGGPLEPAKRVAITAAPEAEWTASVAPDGTDHISIVPASGRGSGAVSIALVDWWAASKAPGEYSIGKVSIRGLAQDLEIQVALKVVPRAEGPAFSYISGPRDCSAAEGYQDTAICTVTHEKPPGDFTPPKAGETYTDENFGATVRILTDPVYRHEYSTPSPISAHNRHVFVVNKSDQLFVVDADTAKMGAQIEGDVNKGVFWDGGDDDVYYAIDGARILKHDLRTHKAAVLVDYSRPPYSFNSIDTGGTGDSTRDNWIAFWAKDQRQICALDLNKIKTYCASYAQLPGPALQFIDFTLMSKGADAMSGKRYVLLMANPAMAVFSVDQAGGTLKFEYRGPEDPEGHGNHDGVCDVGETCIGAPHSDVFQDSSGLQYLVMMSDSQVPCERDLATFALNKGIHMVDPVELGGGKRRIMTVFRCGTNWTGDHIGCAKSSPYCVVSLGYAAGRDPADHSPAARTPHLSEILVMRENGAEIRRLVEHRSVLFKNEEANSYWSTPRAAISDDGSLVVADTNFGIPDSQRVIAIQTGFGQRGRSTVP